MISLLKKKKKINEIQNDLYIRKKKNYKIVTMCFLGSLFGLPATATKVGSPPSRPHSSFNSLNAPVLMSSP